MSHRVDFDILDQLVDNDFDPLYLAHAKGQETTSTCSAVLQPVSPASSDDSGISSLGSDELSIVLSDNSPAAGDSAKLASGVLEFVPQLETMPNFFSFPVEFSNELPVLQNIADDLLERSNSETPHSPEPQMLIESADTPSISSSSSSLGSVGSPSDFDVEPSAVFNLPVVTAPLPIQELTSTGRTSKCGRKSKTSSLEEKKKRKRDQNKSAATRYRVRKRQEAMVREEEFNVLDTKNKSLKDKVSQISREINYLKELMIEVYTIKGLIS